MCNGDCIVSMQLCTHSTWLRGFTHGVTGNKQITLWAMRQSKDQCMSRYGTIPESFQLPLSCDSASQQATAYIYCNLADETGNRRPYRPGPGDNRWWLTGTDGNVGQDSTVVPTDGALMHSS